MKPVSRMKRGPTELRQAVTLRTAQTVNAMARLIFFDAEQDGGNEATKSPSLEVTAGGASSARCGDT